MLRLINPNKKDQEERKRLLEVIAVFFTAILLLALSRLETRLFALSETLSENREFFTTLAYFALININVILILLISFLIFRNVTRLIVERRRGVLGSKLRTKLVFSLVFFALAPTVLLFYVSMKFITNSFETWFSEKVKVTMQQTREAGSLVYKQDQKRLQSLARIALQRIEIEHYNEFYENSDAHINPSKLEGFDIEHGLNSVKIFDLSAKQIWHSQRGWGPEIPERSDTFVSQSIAYFLTGMDKGYYGTVVGEENQDVVKGTAPLRDAFSGKLLGLVLTEVRFETQILKSVERIISDFGNLKPGAQLIRLSYMILMIVITLLIVFSATWLGFYVARAITGPLQSLAGATREIALGNYDITLKVRTDDETGQLVQAFNLMTRDLREHQKNTWDAQKHLQESNEELDRRRQYMEIVLKHITAGVISIDSKLHITSVNAAAERLLGVNGSQLVGSSIKNSLHKNLYEAFWKPISDGLRQRANYHGQLDLHGSGYDVNLMVNATRIYDEGAIELGYVLVFDDAQEQVRAQRVAAWREVARRIAHEIKNPITPIKLNAQRLLRKFHNKFEDDDYEIFGDCIETIITQVDSLRDLVNEFSKFSRLPSIKPVVSNVNDILVEVAKLFSVSYPDMIIDGKELRLTPSFPLDKEQIKRAFVNIFTNAVAAFEEGRQGEIKISSRYLKQLQTVRVEISDNGCGIPKQMHDRVLEPYFSTKDEGTGLGLAIVNQIVSDHGGYLRLGFNRPKGTVVIIELPTGSVGNRV